MFLRLLKMDFVQPKQELLTTQALRFGQVKNMVINAIFGP